MRNSLLIKNGILLKRTALLLMACCISFLRISTAQAACINGTEISIENLLDLLKPILTSQEYTGKVLARAEDAIEYTGELGGGATYANTSFFLWLRNVTSTLMSLADTDLRIVQEELHLYETTECLHVDLIAIEAMIEKARCKLQYSFEEREVVPILLRKPLLGFLNDRYYNLLRGSRDPEYVDVQWGHRQPFDRPAPGWCCPGPVEECVEAADEDACLGLEGSIDPQFFLELDTCVQDSVFACILPSDDPSTLDLETKMCPFHTDYLPPVIARNNEQEEPGRYGEVLDFFEEEEAEGGEANVEEGEKESGAYEDLQLPVLSYGCDKQALMQIQGGLPSSKDAYEAMIEFMDARNTFIDDHKFLKNVVIKESVWMEADPPNLKNFGLGRKTKHVLRSGCSEDDLTYYASSSSSSSASSEEGGGWPPGWPTGAAKWELRGPFSFVPRDQKILREFVDLRTGWESIRPFPNLIKFPSEFASGDIDCTTCEPDYEGEECEVCLAIERAKNIDILDRVVRWYSRNYMKDWMNIQGKKESYIIAKATDPTFQIQEEIRPLHKEVKELSQFATKLDDGLRGFTRDFALFLRITCMFRPCNDRLNWILRTILEEECFPYTNKGLGSGIPDECVDPCSEDCVNPCMCAICENC